VPTLATSATSYATPTQLLRLVDWRLVADWCSDRDGSRPTRASLKDPTSPAGSVLAEVLLAASGDVESNCLRGGMYSVADLQALVSGAAGGDLRAMVAGCAVLRLAGRRSPVSGKLDDIPLAKWTQEKLAALRVGEQVFGLVGQIEAGAAMEATEFVSSDPADVNRTVNAASRFFGNRSRCGGY
jgi:hypothetical protein